MDVDRFWNSIEKRFCSQNIQNILSKSPLISTLVIFYTLVTTKIHLFHLTAAFIQRKRQRNGEEEGGVRESITFYGLECRVRYV